MPPPFTHIDSTASNVRQHWRHFLDRIAARLGATTFAIADARTHERPWLRWMSNTIGTDGGGGGGNRTTSQGATRTTSQLDTRTIS